MTMKNSLGLNFIVFLRDFKQISSLENLY